MKITVTGDSKVINNLIKEKSNLEKRGLISIEIIPENVSSQVVKKEKTEPKASKKEKTE